VFVLNRTLFKPINRILEERDRRTRGRSGEASEILRRVAASLANYEKSVRAAKADGYRIVESQRTEAMAERSSLVSGVRQEISQLLLTEKESIRAHGVSAKVTLDQEARSLAAEIGGKILRRRISETTISNVN
jgi:F-type H+-transporting ATPase subunit b